MRKVLVKATMTDMMHWNLKRALQIYLLERQSDVDGTTIVGGESGGLPPSTFMIGHHIILKHSSVNQSSRLSITLVSGVSSPFTQYFQKEAIFTKDML